MDKYLPGEKVRLLNMTTAVHDQFDLPAFAVPVAIASSDGLVEETAVVDTLTIEPEERRFATGQSPGEALLWSAVAWPHCHR